MKRTVLLTACSLLVFCALVTQCAKKSNPLQPEPTPATPPKILSAYPANAVTALPRNTLIYVTFDQAMDKTATANALTVEHMTGSKDWKYNILIYRPDSLFHASDTVKFTIGTGAKNTSGTALAAPASYWFTCGADADTARPTVASYAPSGLGIGTGATVSAVMSKKLAPWADGAIKLAGATGGSSLQADSVLQFIPSALANNTLYTATVDTTAVDRCGNRMAATFTWTFTTVADTVKPFVTKTEPANADTNVSVTTQVKVHFSEPMDTASVAAALSANPALHARRTWSGDTMLTLAMTDTLSFHTSHQVTVSTGAMDKAGNHLATTHTFTFITARGLYVTSNASNEVYLYQQPDVTPRGRLSFTNHVTQVKMSVSDSIAYLLTSNGLHFRQIRNHNNEPFFTNLSASCYGIAVSPNGLRLAVSDTANNFVYLISAVNGQLLDTFSTVGTPKGMVFSASSQYLYVLSQFNNRVAIYDLSNPTAAPLAVNVPNGGEEMAATPARDYVFAACGLGVTVIRTSDNTVFYTIPGVSNHPFGLAVSPDGQHLAVSCYDEGTVKIYATSNYAAVTSVTVGANPKGLCYSPDSKRLYVANSGGSSFTVISRSGSTYTAIDTKTIGAGPWGIAVTP